MKRKRIAGILAGIMILTSAAGCSPSSKEYNIEGPITQVEIGYTAGADIEELTEYLKTYGHNFILSRHGEGAYIAYNPFCSIDLETGTVRIDTIYYPIICDGRLTGGVAAFHTENGPVGSALSKSNDFSIIDAELAKDPAAEYIFATIGTIGVLISPDNRIIPYSQNDLGEKKIAKFFDKDVDWYSHFKDDYCLISYNKLTAAESGE